MNYRQIVEETEETFGGRDMFIILILVMISWVFKHVCTYQLHTLNIFSLLYVSFTSMGFTSILHTQSSN